MDRAGRMSAEPQAPERYGPPLGTVPPPPPPAPPPRGGGAQGMLRRAFAPIAGAIFLLFKFGAKLKLLLLALPKLKFLTTSLSMLASIGAYTLLWGWRFAVLFVALLFVHEIGHWIELKRQGIPTSPIVFIPFLGAVIGMRGAPRDAYVEAKVGLAGPILGSLGALVVFGLGKYIDSDLLVAAAYVGFLLNLFNLAPIVPLDGGRAAAAIHPYVWVVGLVVMGGLLVISPNPILILILLLGLFEGWGRIKKLRRGEDMTYYRVEPWQRVVIASTFAVLVVGLVVGMHYSHVDT